MKPNSKTPYEIRLELLQLAQIILHNKYEADSRHESMKVAPASEEIIAEAEKLNAFVSKANPSH